MTDLDFLVGRRITISRPRPSLWRLLALFYWWREKRAWRGGLLVTKVTVGCECQVKP